MTNIATSAFRVLREDGISSLLNEGFYFGLEQLLRARDNLTKQSSNGTNVYNEDWDVLIILDACRFDLLQEVVNEGQYDWLTGPEKFKSLGSSSEEWMKNNFTPEFKDEMASTAHVTANLYSQSQLNAEDFLLLDEVWKYGWDDDWGTTPPRPVTDRGIDVMRSQDPDRLILHYMQPHAPFLSEEISFERYNRKAAQSNWGGRDAEKPVWKRMRDGEVDEDSVWTAYKDSLYTVLDDVELLLSNIDAERVVITADHGNAMGESFMYGHPTGIALDCLRNVPWAVTTATDTNDYEPTTKKSNDNLEDEEISRRLQSLGYIE